MAGMLLGCAPKAQEFHVVPMPESVTLTPGSYSLAGKAFYADPAIGENAVKAVERFAAQLALVSGRKSDVSTEDSGQPVRFLPNPNLGEEEYALNVKKSGVTLEASSFNGFLYGIETLKQMLPEKIYGKARAKASWTLPLVSILDSPRFAYRGMMLDPCRHFWSVEETKRIIDIAAAFKINRFHWHLTEDQGWRIEIKKYPRLTEVGAWRPFTADYRDENPDGTPHGGFYTQDDVREVVEYARRRFVTVIPEIELPGHASAAIAAYPQLSCNPDAPHAVATSWGVKTDVFCPNAFTFQFLEDVFTELFDLFPSPYYHIGGDECPKDAWMESDYCKDLMKVLGITDFHELQTFFVRRMDSFLRAHGKTVIGWDEILDGSAVESTVVMSYRGHAPAAKAIQRGMKTILVPNRWTYLDYYQMDPALEPKAQSLYLPIDKVYNYFPAVDSLRTLSDEYIIGYECCVWGEYAQTPERVEYLAFPRAVAAAEVAWCDRGEKDWDSFYRRMRKEFGRLDAKGVRYNRALHNEMFNGGTAYREIPGQLQWKEQ